MHLSKIFSTPSICASNQIKGERYEISECEKRGRASGRVGGRVVGGGGGRLRVRCALCEEWATTNLFQISFSYMACLRVCLKFLGYLSLTFHSVPIPILPSPTSPPSAGHFHPHFRYKLYMKEALSSPLFRCRINLCKSSTKYFFCPIRKGFSRYHCSNGLETN